jgi:hypothetical protein
MADAVLTDRQNVVYRLYKADPGNVEDKFEMFNFYGCIQMQTLNY